MVDLGGLVMNAGRGSLCRASSAVVVDLCDLAERTGGRLLFRKTGGLLGTERLCLTPRTT